VYSRSNLLRARIVGEHRREFFRDDLLARPTGGAGLGEEIEVPVGEMRAVVGIENQDLRLGPV
jgi:hypothetical protein